MQLTTEGRQTLLFGVGQPPMTTEAVEEVLANLAGNENAAELLNPGFLHVLAAVARAWQAKMTEACQNGGGNLPEQHL